MRPWHLFTAFGLTLGACDFSAGTKVFGDSAEPTPSTGSVDGGEGGQTGEGGGAGGAGGAGGTEGSGDDGEEPDPSLLDEDNDGVTVGEGDCDDGDPAVYPGAVDECDGRDEDCDGEVDEDARYADSYEDNDETAVFLGDLSGGGSLSVEALLDSDEDVDRYAFELDDSSWSLWNLTVRLSNIPDGNRWRLRLIRPDGTSAETEESGTATIEQSDEVFTDDAGVWEVVVETDEGAACDAWYLLTVDFDG